MLKTVKILQKYKWGIKIYIYLNYKVELVRISLNVIANLKGKTSGYKIIIYILKFTATYKNKQKVKRKKKMINIT